MSENEHDFYANSVHVTTGLYDLILMFRLETLVAVESDKPPVTEAKGACNIRMSPQHGKALAALLIGHIIGYEERFGKLPMQPDLQESWNKHIKED